ncbi:MAG: trypsin-like peptidase domain-containing protein [Acidobacteriota bacterium]
MTETSTPASMGRGRQALTFLLIFGAVVFGMVLAGGMQWTPVGWAQDDPGPVTVDARAGGIGLPSFADLAEAVSPAVVSVEVSSIETVPRGRGRGVDPFEFFFGPRRERQNPDSEGDAPRTRRRSESSGSGFVISADGLIVTNHHVIDDADRVNVRLGGKIYEAEVRGDDPATDIALLKIEPDAPLTYLELGDSEKLRVGEWIMVIGSPLQLGQSVSVGVVSAKGRAINITPDRSLENFIQTDAAINLGNSGGPLLDLAGRVVGIATAMNFGAENIGFAVPVETLERILPQLRDEGTVRRGYLGVSIRDVDERLAQAFDLPSAEGVLAVEVVPSGPGDDAGIEHGDVILSLDGETVEDTRGLIDRVSSMQPGDKVEVELMRNGERMQRTVTLGERTLQGEVPREAEQQEEGRSSIEWLGIEVQDLSEQVRGGLGIPPEITGVWVREVQPESPLYEERVGRNDIIVEINGQPVTDVARFEALVDNVESGGFLRLYVRRYSPAGDESVGFFAIVAVP